MLGTEAGLLDDLAQTLILGALLDKVRARWGGYVLRDHFQQGEFHHDVVLELDSHAGLPGPVLVVATNCNGGVKEVLCLAEAPPQGALWHWRCPENPDFEGPALHVLGRATTPHWFDPCELLLPDARSEYRAEHRERQCGGGWRLRVGGGGGAS
ncbi:MAG: hypothetical protein QM756_46335 [Polyangiaceae bacterium]